MTSVENVHSQFFPQGISPMRTFARDECVHAFGGRLLQVTACPTRHHADAPANRWTTGDNTRFGPGGAPQSADKVGSRGALSSLESDELAVIEEKRPQLFQS